MNTKQEAAIARCCDHENLVGELVEACELSLHYIEALCFNTSNWKKRENYGLHYIEALCFNTPKRKKRENYASVASKLRAVIAKAKESS